MARTSGAPWSRAPVQHRSEQVAAPVDHTGGTAVGARARTDVRTWLWVHLGTLVLAVPVLAWVNRDQWFAGDEWQIVTTNGLGSNPARAGIFAPHFEHWTTVGILVYKALYGVFALRTYVPYFAVLFAVILAVAHLTWRLLLRIGVVPSYATAVAALTMVLAAGWENRSTAWQMVVIAPVALGFGALLVMPARGPLVRRDAVVVALLVVALMCSGTGVTMTAVVALAALLRRGWRVTLGILALPAAAYALWYALEGASGQRNDTALSTALGDLPGFVWRGLTGAFSGLTRVPDSGTVVLAALVVWLVWRARPRLEPWPLVVATTVGAVFSIALTGVRRAGAGPESRFVDIVVLLALPALALMTQEAGRALLRRFGQATLAVCSVLVVAFLVVQVIALDDEVSHETFVGEMRPRVLATAQILRDHEPIASGNIFGIPYLTEPSASTIGRLDRNGELPAIDVSTADVLTAREYVEVVIGDASAYPEGVATLVSVSDASTGAAADPGCVALASAAPGSRPVARLRLPAAGSFRVITPGEADVWLTFVERGQRGRPRPFTAGPGDGTAVGISRATDAELELPPGTTTLCGLGSASVASR
jgi:hypothetical protein